ncbi:MAG: hypothetical protein WBQ25_05605 [Nitrososphaeraceae archaeon]
MIHRRGKIQYGTTTIPYHTIKTKHVKTYEIIVDSDEVIARTQWTRIWTTLRRSCQARLLGYKKTERI